jgi:hypothetical protein
VCCEWMHCMCEDVDWEVVQRVQSGRYTKVYRPIGCALMEGTV